MAARNVDIKLQFAEYDGTPGLGARNFRKNLILSGGCCWSRWTAERESREAARILSTCGARYCIEIEGLG